MSAPPPREVVAGPSADSPNVATRFQACAAERPDATALVFADGRDGDRARWASWTYRTLAARADAYSHGFSAQGLRRGDRVLFLVRPSLEFYALLLGLLQLGAVPVVVDPGMGFANVLACVEQIRPRGVVALPVVHAVRLFARRAFRTAEVFVTVGTRWFWGGVTHDDCRVERGPFPIPPFAADDEAFIVFTSGSTGTPKGVSFRHGMFAGATRLMQQVLGLGPGRTSMETFAPFVPFHLACGETVVVPDMDLSKPAEADPARILEAIAAHRPSTVFASPVVLRNLARHAHQHGARLDGVSQILTGVAPVPGELLLQLRDLLPDEGRVVVNYGATEALTVTSIASDEVLAHTWAETRRGAGTCVGRPYPEMEVAVIRVTDQPIPTWSDELVVPDGQIGEIVVGGPVVSPEYKESSDGNARSKIARDGRTWHRTGDLGYLDADRRLWFCGRKAQRLETARGMVPNVPLQNIFDEHPAVARTALVGVGDRGAERAVLCVELAPGAAWDAATEKELLAMADGTRWAGIVERVLVHPGFPMDARHNSKIRNEELRTWATAR